MKKRGAVWSLGRFIFLLSILAPSVLFATEKWFAVGQNANDIATKEKKLVLQFYKRCNWAEQWSDLLSHDSCMKLDQEVFASAEFQDFARKHLVLEVFDFSKDAPSDDKTMQMLHQSLNYWEPSIKAYPTVLLHDSNWVELGRREGYQTGGAQAFMDWLRKAAIEKAKK